MDKLQPIIKHRFWILVAIAIPLAIYGYSTAGKVPEEAENRAKQIDTVKTGVDSGMGKPNERFSAELAAVNATYSRYVDDAIVEVWDKQKARMVWPTGFQEKVPAQFGGDFPKITDRYMYQTQVYHPWMDQVYEHVNPVLPMTPGVAPSNDPVQYLNQKVIVTAQLPEAVFPNSEEETIGSQTIWDAQIDSWFLTLLFDAVSRTNSVAETVADVPLRRIDRLEFMGGTGVAVGGPAVAAAPVAVAAPEDDLAALEDAYNRRVEMELAIAAGEYRISESTNTGPSFMPAAAAPVDSVAFAPDQEFGPLPGPPAAGLVPTPGQGVPENNAARRYIAFNPDAPYVQRGFYLSLTILENRIPNFLAELSNSDWPVRIDRFHVGVNPYAERMTAGLAGRNRDQPQLRGGGLGGGLRGPALGGINPNQLGRGGIQASRWPRMNNNNIPPYALSALKHPELVQLELCGRITMFKPPVAVLTRVAAANPASNPPAAPVPAPDASAPNP